MKQILIPTDFSENSQHALQYAMEYFKEIPASFYLLHVSQDNKSGNVANLQNFQQGRGVLPLIQNPTIKLRETVKQCQDATKNPQHRFFGILENISLVEAIRKQLHKMDIDCILMGTKGASNVAQEVGRNTFEVITKVKCPVIVIPENAEFKGIQNILFPTDYNCIYKDRVVDMLFDTWELHRATLRIVNTKTREQNLSLYQIDNQRFLQNFFKKTGHSFHFLESKNIEMGVQNFVGTWEIDMIALIAKNLNLLQRLLFRPSVGGITYHRKIPFLVIHE